MRINTDSASIVIDYIYYIILVCRNKWLEITKPITNMVSEYSESFGVSLERFFDSMFYILITIPIFIVSLVIPQYIVQNNIFLNNIQNIQFEYDILLSFIFGLSALTYLLVKIIKYNRFINVKKTFMVFLFLASTSYIYYVVSGVHIYAFTTIVLYSFGIYTTSIVKRKYNGNYQKIMSIEPKKKLKNINIIGFLSLNSIIIIGHYQIIQLNIEYIILLLGFISYLITNKQNKIVRQIYEGLNISTNSQKWILTSRLSVFSGIIITLVDTNLFYPFIFLLYVPLVISVLFIKYLEKPDEINEKMHTSTNIPEIRMENLRGSQKESIIKGGTQTYNNLDFESEFVSKNDNISAYLDSKLEVAIPENIDSTTSSWVEFITTIYYMKKIATILGSDEKEDIDNLYNESLVESYKYFYEKRIPWDLLPQEIQYDLKQKSAEIDNIELPAIVDIHEKEIKENIDLGDYQSPDN